MMVRLRPSIYARLRTPQAQNLFILPTAAILPAVMAIASTNEGTPFVAILALCKMSSADTAVSVRISPNGLRRAEEAPPFRFYL